MFMVKARPWPRWKRKADAQRFLPILTNMIRLLWHSLVMYIRYHHGQWAYYRTAGKQLSTLQRLVCIFYMWDNFTDQQAACQITSWAPFSVGTAISYSFYFILFIIVVGYKISMLQKSFNLSYLFSLFPFCCYRWFLAECHFFFFFHLCYTFPTFMCIIFL